MSELRAERHSAGSLPSYAGRASSHRHCRGMTFVLVLGSIDDEREGLQHHHARNHNLLWAGAAHLPMTERL